VALTLLSWTMGGNSFYYGVKLAQSARDWQGLRRINNSSKCSNCYGSRAFGDPAVFCNISYLSY